MRIKNEELTLDGTDMTSNIASNPIWLGHIANLSIQAVYSGSPKGVFKLQASNDEGSNDLRIASATINNWTDLDGTIFLIKSAGNSLWNIEDCGYRWLRLVWIDDGSTSGTLTSARMNVKGV